MSDYLDRELGVDGWRLECARGRTVASVHWNGLWLPQCGQTTQEAITKWEKVIMEKGEILSAMAKAAKDIGGDHARASAAFREHGVGVTVKVVETWRHAPGSCAVRVTYRFHAADGSSIESDAVGSGSTEARAQEDAKWTCLLQMFLIDAAPQPSVPQPKPAPAPSAPAGAPTPPPAANGQAKAEPPKTAPAGAPAKNGPAKPEPKKEEKTPKDGTDLVNRILAYEKKLKLEPDTLINHVIEQARLANPDLSADMRAWPADAIELAIGIVKKYPKPAA